MMGVVAFIVSLAGFAALALAMGKHHRDLFGSMPVPSRVRGFRILGCVLLGASLAAAVRQSGPSIGLVLWTGLIALSAALVVLLLTYKDKWWHG